MEKLYRIEEEDTTGWIVTDPQNSGLNKELASQRYNQMLAQGVAPNRLRIVREQ